MKQAERIKNAVIETLFGQQYWISGAHPLSKSKCVFCEAMITVRDMQGHLKMFHAQVGRQSEAVLQQHEEDENERELSPLFEDELTDETPNQDGE